MLEEPTSRGPPSRPVTSTEHTTPTQEVHQQPHFSTTSRIPKLKLPRTTRRHHATTTRKKGRKGCEVDLNVSIDEGNDTHRFVVAIASIVGQSTRLEIPP